MAVSLINSLVNLDDENTQRIWIEELRQVLTIEDWIEITPEGSGGYVDFDNSWDNIGSGQSVAAFYKDPFKRVHLKGSIDTGGSNTTAFTLPVGYRPDEELYFPALQSAGAAGSYVKIQTDGSVVPTRSAANIFLNNISFRV